MAREVPDRHGADPSPDPVVRQLIRAADRLERVLPRLARARSVYRDWKDRGFRPLTIPEPVAGSTVPGAPAGVGQSDPASVYLAQFDDRCEELRLVVEAIDRFVSLTENEEVRRLYSDIDEEAMPECDSCARTQAMDRKGRPVGPLLTIAHVRKGWQVVDHQGEPVRDKDGNPLHWALCRWCYEFVRTYGRPPAASLVEYHVRDNRKVTAKVLRDHMPDLAERMAS